MKVLQVNKYYYQRSGTERYLFNLARLLEEQGHTSIPWAMHHPRNEPSPYDRWFLAPMDFHDLRPRQVLPALRRVIYDRGAARQLGALLDETRPDLVHVHNIYHHISPAILPEIRRRGIPIVHSLHDYQRICPNYQLLAGGQVCERCRGHRYHQPALRRCLHGSLAWSLLAGLAAAVHHRLQVYERHVGCSLVSSRFMWTKVVAFGLDPARLALLPYFLFPADLEPDYTPGRDLLYVGRLSPEKGLPTLLRAMERLPGLSLLVVGEGPQRPALERQAARDGLANVRFAGYLAGRALHDAVRAARLVVVPSEWYEPFGQVAIEALALGKAVAVARSGGLAELVADGVDGRIFAPGDPAELAAVLGEMAAAPAALARMGRAGRARVETLYGPARHFDNLLAAYRQAGLEAR